MKTAIVGYSGSGKSTLAEALGRAQHADVLHLDTVHFLPGWAERGREEEQRLAEAYLDTHSAWVIDGNYTKLSYERRMAEADRIIILLFGRFSCLRRVIQRYRRYKNTVRPTMAAGCPEKLDAAFAAWILWRGRSRAYRAQYTRLQRQYPEKVIVLKNQRELDAFYRSAGIG